MATETGEGTTETPATESADDLSAETTDDTSTKTQDNGDESGHSQHMRAVIVTSGATLLGVLAAVVSTIVATEGGEPDNLLGFAVLMGFVFIQFPLYNLLGVKSDSLETKDQIYIFAMTFIMWFVAWTVFLTTGALQ